MNFELAHDYSREDGEYHPVTVSLAGEVIWWTDARRTTPDRSIWQNFARDLCRAINGEEY